MINSLKWVQLSLAQQLGNLASEMTRARHWEMKNDVVNCNRALERALDLLDLTLTDNRWRFRRRELTLLREIICDCFSPKKEYEVSLSDLEKYCTDFALSSRRSL